MKRRWKNLAAILALVLALLCGCGAEGQVSAGDMAPAEPQAEESESEVLGPMEDAASMAELSDPLRDAKLIYRGSMDLETTAFDDAVAGLQALVAQCGGYVQSGSIYDYNGGYRSADYVVRIPTEHYQAFFTGAGELCHVTHQSQEKENITTRYYDTSGRLKTQETKLARLQELLARAESMEDLITIESAISETEAAIDALSGEMRNYDDLVDFSTVTLFVREVYKLSSTEEPATGFGSRLGTAFTNGCRNFLSGAEDLLVTLVYNWLWVALLAAGAALAVHIRRRRRAAAPVPREKKPLFRKKSDDKPDET